MSCSNRVSDPQFAMPLNNNPDIENTINNAIKSDDFIKICKIVMGSDRPLEYLHRAFLASGAYNKLKMIKKFLNLKLFGSKSAAIQVNVKNCRILVNAVKFGYIKMQDYLLEHTDADPIADFNLFKYAIEYRQLETMKRMLQWKRTANWSLGEIDHMMQRTPAAALQIAIENDYVDILFYLIDSYQLHDNAKVMQEMLQMVLDSRNINMLNTIIKKYNLSSEQPAVRSAITYAIDNSHSEMLAILALLA